MRSMAAVGTAGKIPDTMAETVVEAEVAVVRGVEGAIRGESSHPALASIATCMAITHTPALSATLQTTLTSLQLHFPTCKVAAPPTASDGVGRHIQN